MTIYYSKSTKAFYHTELIAVSAMPGDVVSVTTTKHSQLLAQQTAGYVIAPDGNGAPQAVQQGLTRATGTKASHDKDGNVISATYVKTVNNVAPVNGNVSINTTDANAVHKTGNETIDGTKTFNATIAGSINGNAATATKLKTARTIAISGGATGTATGFDGSGNISIPVTSLDASKLTGTAPVDTTGNAATATKLKTARTIALSGAATGTATSFDGHANITIPVTSLAANKLTGTAAVDTTGNAATATKATKADSWTYDMPLLISDYNGAHDSNIYNLNAGDGSGTGLQMFLPSILNLTTLNLMGTSGIHYLSAQAHRIQNSSGGYAQLVPTELLIAGSDDYHARLLRSHLVFNAPAASDTTATITTGQGTATITRKGNAGEVLISGAGVKFAGFNVLGSTIMAKALGSTAYEYGGTIAGSKLCWAAWDDDGGQYRDNSDGSLGLAGTWVKVSGDSNTTHGMGLWRRIA